MMADVFAELVAKLRIDTANFDKQLSTIKSQLSGFSAASLGNITLKNVKEAALSGVDIISVGALTHSYKSLDIRIEYES